MVYVGAQPLMNIKVGTICRLAMIWVNIGKDDIALNFRVLGQTNMHNKGIPLPKLMDHDATGQIPLTI